MKKPRYNPFRIHGVVEGEYFTNRTDEIERMVIALTEPGSKLLVYGPRRMGKTSAILQAIARVNEAGEHAFLADLSTASTAVDMGNKILAEASRVLGKKWKGFISDIVSKLTVSISLTPDPRTGTILPSMDFNLRDRNADEQRKTLGSVLDAINEIAGERKITIGIALDEFQEINNFGGETAEWDLRGTIQRHGNVSYLLAGSKEHLVHRMILNKGALYKIVDKMPLGPMDVEYFANWIDSRLRSAGIKAAKVGADIVRAAGPRTRDVVQVARKCFDLTNSKGMATSDDIDQAFKDIVDEEYDLLLSHWSSLTAHQQNVLRAVAAGMKGLTTKETLKRFGLGTSGTAVNTANTLIRGGYLIKNDPYSHKRVTSSTGYEFDSPFFKSWVMKHTLADIGLIPKE
jgi:AAA+ ATPase superfamily predicted ATPase